MRHLIISALLLAACGKSTPNPAPSSAPEPTKPTPSAPAKPEPTAQAKPEPVAPSDAYLVWIADVPKDYTTVLVEGGTATPKRKQAMVFAGGSLWGIEYRYRPFRERECDFENPESTKGKLGPEKHLPWLAAKALLGDGKGNEVTLFEAKSDYFGTDAELIGGYDGRSISLDGGAAETLLTTQCEGAYSCGAAHPNHGCSFNVVSLDGTKPTVDLKGTTTAIANDTKTLVAGWQKDLGEDGFDGESAPAVEAVSLLANNGEPQARYTLVVGVPYVATDGDWSAYTQSKDHVGAIAPALNLQATPEPVRQYLKAQGISGVFGWSKVPAENVADVKAALADASTLPPEAPPEPAADTAPGAADAGALVDEGRKLTHDKKYPEAIAAFDKALTLEPRRARALSGRAYAHLLSGDRVNAKKDFQSALALDENPKFQAAIYYNLGELLEQDGEPNGALAAYMKANSLSPSDAARKRIEALAK